VFRKSVSILKILLMWPNGWRECLVCGRSTVRFSQRPAKS